MASSILTTYMDCVTLVYVAFIIINKRGKSVLKIPKMIQFTMIKYYCLLSLPELNVIYLSFHFSHIRSKSGIDILLSNSLSFYMYLGNHNGRT